MSDNQPDNDRTSSHDAIPAERSGQKMPLALVVPVSVALLVVLLGLPLLAAINGEHDAEAGSPATGIAGYRLAQVFASALLETRSAVVATRYALPDSHEQIEEIVSGLAALDATEHRGARAVTHRIPCEFPDLESDCFVASLEREGEPPIEEVVFTVGLVNGTARVIAVNRRATGRGGRR